MIDSAPGMLYKQPAMEVCCSAVSVSLRPNIRDSFTTRLDPTRPSALDMSSCLHVLKHSEALFTACLSLNSHISLLILTPQKQREHSQANISYDTQPSNALWNTFISS